MTQLAPGIGSLWEVGSSEYTGRTNLSLPDEPRELKPPKTRFEIC